MMKLGGPADAPPLPAALLPGPLPAAAVVELEPTVARDGDIQLRRKRVLLDAQLAGPSGSPCAWRAGWGSSPCRPAHRALPAPILPEARALRVGVSHAGKLVTVVIDDTRSEEAEKDDDSISFAGPPRT